MLKISHLNQQYGQAHILRDIDLDLPSGEVVALLGRNGVGKTTLLKSVMGLLPIKSGKIEIGDVDITGRRPEQRARDGVGYVPQGRLIFSSLSVEENLSVGLGALPRGERRLPPMIFELFPVLSDMLDRKGGNLSGGQQQQLAIARALVLKPSLLILDEPTEGIQPSIVNEIAQALKTLNSEFDMTVWIVEQKLPIIQKIANRFHIMNRGAVVASGSIETLDEETMQTHLTV